MMTTKPIPWIMLSATFSMFVIGCAENPEPKNPADYNAGSPAHPQGGLTTGEQAKVDAQPPPQPPPPQQQPPSTLYKGVECEYNGEVKQVNGGEMFTIRKEQQFYCYSRAASADCSNVSVSGATKSSKAGICQIGVLPIEQKLSGTVSVSIDVGGTKVSFSVQVSGGNYVPASYKAKK